MVQSKWTPVVLVVVFFSCCLFRTSSSCHLRTSSMCDRPSVRSSLATWGLLNCHLGTSSLVATWGLLNCHLGTSSLVSSRSFHVRSDSPCHLGTSLCRRSFLSSFDRLHLLCCWCRPFLSSFGLHLLPLGDFFFVSWTPSHCWHLPCCSSWTYASAWSTTQ